MFRCSGRRRWAARLAPGAVLAAFAWGCGAPDAVLPDVRVDGLRARLAVLAADSMEGRRAGTPGAARAARFIAEQLASFGVSPAGDSGYFQRVPLARDAERPERLQLLESFDAMADLPPGRAVVDVNVVGLVRGGDPEVGGEAVIVGAHYDHVGVRRPVNGDSIYNGADDDASGVAAVLEIARVLAADAVPPRRTVVLLLTTGEEMGMLGTRWYADRPAIPLDRTVADLQIEMIARPDTALDGAGRAWLTGYERSTMGRMFAAAGLSVFADPRPDENFFMRSDNVVYAYRGIPAHTLSSFGLHGDYHRPSDEADRADIRHMAQVVQVAVDAVRLLANGDRPEWRAGGRPVPRAQGRDSPE